MASTEQGRRPRRSFTEQYKAEVVALCRGSEKPMSEIAVEDAKAMKAQPA